MATTLQLFQNGKNPSKIIIVPIVKTKEQEYK